MKIKGFIRMSEDQTSISKLMSRIVVPADVKTYKNGGFSHVKAALPESVRLNLHVHGVRPRVGVVEEDVVQAIAQDGLLKGDTGVIAYIDMKGAFSGPRTSDKYVLISPDPKMRPDSARALAVDPYYFADAKKAFGDVFDVVCKEEFEGNPTVFSWMREQGEKLRPDLVQPPTPE